MVRITSIVLLGITALYASAMPFQGAAAPERELRLPAHTERVLRHAANIAGSFSPPTQSPEAAQVFPREVPIPYNQWPARSHRLSRRSPEPWITKGIPGPSSSKHSRHPRELGDIFALDVAHRQPVSEWQMKAKTNTPHDVPKIARRAREPRSRPSPNVNSRHSPMHRREFKLLHPLPHRFPLVFIAHAVSPSYAPLAGPARIADVSVLTISISAPERLRRAKQENRAKDTKACRAPLPQGEEEEGRRLGSTLPLRRYAR
ncbi:hypothetical protein HYPSUDRAFT_208928 [Hypholoma sublateritium FD-334 SS-4]|uniref:Uncharacterized protein n=1 Tax=Hypholoma sublateritium (strain FD-334 SS-4) TaxID=945553 RepID=A0A0D2LTP6_HYPSF|nr:hypothetical protein HYPSUDRAFT_208928 [Hypholoma sublateritium FD-334 SS-4]